MNDLFELLDSMKDFPITEEIQNAFVKAWDKVHGYEDFTLYPKIMVSISGGADSDLMIDMIEKIGHPISEVHYVFFDTGIEFEATKKAFEVFRK